MIVAAVPVSFSDSTTELQAWLDAHPNITIDRIVTLGSVFFIFYTE